MNIDGATLVNEYQRASHSWPFITAMEIKYGLPRFMLYAVGSRETNLTNEVGDGGHGHGVFQLDDRSHVIPSGFDSNVALQAETAAHMLYMLRNVFGGSNRAALAAYNAGIETVQYNISHDLNIDTGTAGGDYSNDTLARCLYLQNAFTPPANGKEKTPMYLLKDSATVHVWIQYSDGSVRYVPNDVVRRAYMAMGVPQQDFPITWIEQQSGYTTPPA